MMKRNNPSNFIRLRLPGFDYTNSGAYFVTVVSCQRLPIFGEVAGAQVKLSPIGSVVKKTWEEIPVHFSFTTNEIYVIMPDHIHGIIWIDHTHISPPVAATHASPPQRKTATSGPKSNSLGAIIGSFKSATTKRCHDLKLTLSPTLWQRNYYEHVIRDELELERIRDYIEENPENWVSDNEESHNFF